MDAHFDEISSRLLSPRLWKGFGSPTSMNPTGSSFQTPSGNPAFGVFDDFFTFNATTLVGPYANLLAAGCTAALAADTATEKGVLAIATDADVANEDAVVKWGGTASAPFFLANNDLAFECRLSVSSIVAAKWSYAVGLGEASMIAADSLFADGGALADKNFVGFNHLVAEGAAIDAAYKADGQAYQDGATKTKLNALHNAVASTYVKLGFRYRAAPKSLEFYVNGRLAGSASSPARLTASELDAVTFPDDVFLAPFIGIKTVATGTPLTINIDWLACAQYE